MRRVLVVGITGAGKTTAARQLAAVLHVPFHEMDALAFGPGWSTPPNFADSVERILPEPGWVFDSYGYEAVRDAMWAAADTIVWLDYPLLLIMTRVVRRSLSRSLKRTRIFGGNVERWSSWLTVEHPVWWAATRFRARREYISRRTGGPSSAHLTTVHLGSPREFDRWLRRQTGSPAPRGG